MESIEEVILRSRRLIEEDKIRVGSLELHPIPVSPHSEQQCSHNIMLRAGEYSPNNPESGLSYPTLGADRDVFLGFGLYEERRKKLLQRRHNEYQEYLAKQNQINHSKSKKRFVESENETKIPNLNLEKSSSSLSSTVAVQTNLEELLSLSPMIGQNNKFLTKAERELSPQRTTYHNKTNSSTQINASPRLLQVDESIDKPSTDDIYHKKEERCQSPSNLLKNIHGSSLLDAEAIKYRNMIEQQECAAKRLAYQEDLKNQIKEQQRIREEKRMKEKHAEELEAIRLEKQFQMLQISQEIELNKQKQINIQAKINDVDFNKNKEKLEKRIDVENTKLRKKKIHHEKTSNQRSPVTKQDLNILSSNSQRNNLFVGQDMPIRKQPYSFNYSENSVFLPSYSLSKLGTYNSKPLSIKKYYPEDKSSNENKLQDIHFSNKENQNSILPYEPKFLRKDINDLIDSSPNIQSKDSLPIPVLRHSTQKMNRLESERSEISNKNIENVEDKWRVPAIQKNIMKYDVNLDGKQESILTQLGSIRKQLQLEQLKLDQTNSVFKTKPFT